MIPPLVAALAAAALVLAAPSPITAPAQEERAPAVTWRSALNVDVYESGFLGFSQPNVAFAPKQPGACSIVIREQGGEVLKSIGFYAGRFDGWANRSGVFASLQPENPAEHTFEAGEYVIEYYIADQFATRVPFTVEPHTESDDPFDPASTLRFVGPWQHWAYFVFDEQDDGSQIVEMSLWAGASDLGHGESGVPVSAVIERDGETVARTKRGNGFYIDHVWMKRRDAQIFVDHAEGDELGTAFLTRAELEKDGDYRVTITREDDGTVLRKFTFAAQDGALVPHPRTVLGYEPHPDYIAPRVLREGTTTFEFEEAFWIEARK